MRVRPLWFGPLSLCAVACIPTPQAGELTSSDTALPYDPTEPYVPGDTDPTNSGGPGGADATTAEATATDTSDSTGGSSGPDPTGGAVTGATGGSTGGDPGGPVGAFDEVLPFGDDATETDLVGVWGAPWDPTGLADFTLTVGEDGTFAWRETSADCSVDQRATGVLWVEDGQLVLHVETWDKRMPWDTEAEIGVKVYTPFRLRLGYTRFATYLGLAGPRGLTQMWDWQGRSFDRGEPPVGVGPQGRWTATAELWGLVDGPQLIVRETFSADLLGGGNATLARDRVWTWPGPEPIGDPPEVDAGAWEDLSPGNAAGAATIVTRTYAYDADQLFTFASGQSLRRGVASDC